MSEQNGKHPKVVAAFRDLLPGELGEEARTGLETSITAEGCRDPLVVWKEKGVLVDGHRRLEVCRRLGKPYRVVERSFADEGEAQRWALANQRDRRNLTPDQLEYLRGKLYESEEKTPGKRSDLTSGKTCPRSAAERIAEREGVSPRTVKNNAAFARAVDALEAAAPGAKAAALSGEVPRARVVAVANVLADNPALGAAAVGDLLTPPVRAKTVEVAKLAEEKPDPVRAAAERWLADYREARAKVSFLASDTRRLGPANVIQHWKAGERKNAIAEWRGIKKSVDEILEQLESLA